MLIHLEHYSAPFLHCNPSFSSTTKSFNKIRRNINAVEKDSEFEVDPDEAREALRKLDNQLQSLSTKQLSTPKIRAAEVKPWSPEEESSEASGSFWAYAVLILLLFTIFYNILFVTVIKPSIDVPLPVESIDVTE